MRRKDKEKDICPEEEFMIARMISEVLLGNLSEEDAVYLEKWKLASEEHMELYKAVMDEENRKRLEKEFSFFDKNAGWENFCRKRKLRKQRKMRFDLMKYAAIIAIPLGIAFYMWRTEIFPPHSVLSSSHCVAPGTQKAVLTLSDGEVVDLGAGGMLIIKDNREALIYNDSSRISYETAGREKLKDTVSYNILEVPRCGEYGLRLSDGTVVHLNSMSKLRYPVNFSGDKREVELVGEAYFEVAKNEDMPFVVKTPDYDVTVLGTRFNVFAYEEERISAVTLVGGSVLVSGGNFGISGQLNPDEHFVLDKETGAMEISTVDVHDFIAWKDGKFRFRDVRLEDIMKAFSRWYEVEVVYENREVKDFRFGLNVDRNTSIEPILRIFELNGKVKIEREGNLLRIKKGR